MPRFRHKPNKERLMIVYRRRRRRRKRERGGMQRVKRLLLRSLITNLKMLSRFYLQVLILTNNIISLRNLLLHFCFFLVKEYPRLKLKLLNSDPVEQLYILDNFTLF